MFTENEWNIIEDSFDSERHMIAESIFAIGNGRMGQRANFEEAYSGKTLQGNYIGGVFYPDKTRVGWWKNGYPDYFAKVINAPSWIGIYSYINGELLDLSKVTFNSFERNLDMKEGVLSKKCLLTMSNGIQLYIESKRFISLTQFEVGAIHYKITPKNTNCTIKIQSFIQSEVYNQDSNYNECFWKSLSGKCTSKDIVAVDRTTKSPFDVPQFTLATAIKNSFSKDVTKTYKKDKLQLSEFAECELRKDESLVLEKLAVQVSSLNHDEKNIESVALQTLQKAEKIGFNKLLMEHKKAWAEKWEMSDIIIKGDVKAQQGIRFNIFHLQQTYTGEDSRLNIGPKGFTGEKYGGVTYWDTEAFCFPFYLATSPESVSRNLLLYRYKQLDRAIANGEKLGFSNGAALYPMVTVTGDECHNEWEITFEEIHRNGAIAHAIFDYVTYTNDKAYIVDFGLEVLIGISRFWAQRVTLSPIKRKYMILGVTGPNEYENNVSNNWYTNYYARWCLSYTMECISWVKSVAMEQYKELTKRISFEELELARWSDIVNNMYLPFDDKYGIILQQDGYLDKEPLIAANIPTDQRPINQHWSWDRILRSPFIKQADVVQGLYVFEDDFEPETLKKNFDFYEARCVHESSLSPCIHSVVASKIGEYDKAYELYLRTARLDLDDYNKEAKEGLHITSMSGSWLAIVKGFAGMRVHKHEISFNPYIPTNWKSYSFSIIYQGALLTIDISKKLIKIALKSGKVINLKVYGEEIKFVDGKAEVKIKNEKINLK